MKPILKKYARSERELSGIAIDKCYLWAYDSFDKLQPFIQQQQILRSTLKEIKHSLQLVEKELSTSGFNESSDLFSQLEPFINSNETLFTFQTYSAIEQAPTLLSGYSSRIKSHCASNSSNPPKSLSQADLKIDRLFELHKETLELAKKCFITDLPFYLRHKKRKSTMTDIYIGHAKNDMSKIVVGKFDRDSRSYLEHYLIED